ncbi:hypothetical protein KL918_001189 [Ogataea parapolymorpha]|uniref:Maintenance of mitochondrial morphology protein 1 n=1 Tax=Ogataea parapolymorpha (strain ATCC 26012 / BCRC 20466 / JCM 22074 / NRRL Y-7560 / DL-1) TaxID=871575 RepID=W1QEI9_OGAPD|nr:Maintenance of mitochondrial morphology protein 1 [Ogataea parapolymorpha DL-1]ESW99874.1 Maintenance of mitochondrial morphology protein 1 [Ogataea parapolymorpha DL-1]KAG7868546.1 hypothetical protein KL918_001189 [Ogataea parapolymorpha]KAG7874671.1 hypothetical protein KL916_001437 [Ogataea parapolymorpha]
MSIESPDYSDQSIKELSQKIAEQIVSWPPEHRLIATPQSTWTFTQGLILGQLSVIVLFVMFIRFFIFSESAPTVPGNSKKVNVPVLNAPNAAQENEDSTIDTILEKTYYDVRSHQPESLDWFNVLVAQLISQFRNEALNNNNIHRSLNEVFGSSIIPDFLDKIVITEISIGNDFPIFSNCRIKNTDGRLEAKIDVDVADTLTLGVETKLLINQPKPLAASLPVKLSVSIVRFSGCLTVSLISSAEESDATDNSVGLMFSFSPDFRLEFDIKSLIGSRTKLENIPRISSIIENTLRNWFIERCIEPRFQFIKLPSLWPRKKTTRQTTTGDEDETI